MNVVPTHLERVLTLRRRKVNLVLSMCKFPLYC